MLSTSSNSSSSGGKAKRGCLPLVMLLLSIGGLGCFFDAGDPSTYLDPSYLLFPIITIVLFIVHGRKKQKNSAQCTHNAISDSPTVTAGEAISKKVSFDDAVIESLTQQFIAFDIETTGLSPTNDRIVELGAVLFCNGEPVRQFTTLVNPGIPIPASATAVNHITNRMLSSAPTEQEAYPQLIEFLGDALQGEIIMCAHNASFDFNFLCNTLSRLGYNATIKYVDTLHLSRKYIFGLPDYKQSTLEQHFGLTNPTAHRASTDAENCGKILCHILDDFTRMNNDVKQTPTLPKSPTQSNAGLPADCASVATSAKPIPIVSRTKEEKQSATKSFNNKPMIVPGKAILQLSDDGTVIKEYVSVAEASRVIGVSTKSIRCAATGVQKHAGGYRWQYKEPEKNQ